MTESDHSPSYHYRICGLAVRSDFELPMQARRPPEEVHQPDVFLRLGDVPESLSPITHRGANWATNERSFLLDLPYIGRFLSEDGCRITLCPAPEAFLDDLAVFVTGTAMAAILYQRGATLLHGSAVILGGRAFLFCGASGAGKSTIAAALVRDGATFLADDLCSIDLSSGHAPTVLADGRCLRLHPDSIDHIGLRDEMGGRVRRHIDKFHVAPGPSSQATAESAPLGGIYILSRTHAAAPAGIRPMPTLEAAQSLLHHMYKRRLALAYARQGRMAAETARLLSRVPVFHLRRPMEFGHLDASAAMVGTHWASLG